VTRLGLLLLTVTAVPVALAAALPGLLLPALALLVVAAALVVVDSRRAAGPARLSAVRQHDEMLSVGRDNLIQLRMTARGGRVHARVRDEVAPRLECGQADRQLTLPGTVDYLVRPAARGEEPFGRAIVRATGPWGLAFRQTALPIDELISVEADLAGVRIYEALARRGQLAELGVRTIRRPGEGSEFERIREAVPDDSLRSINWKATARSGRLMATELIPERAQPVIVCIDHGRLMGVGAGELTKLDHAINAALLLLHVAITAGDRAGLYAFAEDVTTVLPPRSGRLQVQRFLDAVRPLRPSQFDSDYAAVFTRLSRDQSRRALLCIFTDVLDADQSAALIAQCTRLRRRHVPLVITVRDPALVDAAQALPVDAAATYARAVAGGMISDREDTRRLLEGSGVEALDADARTLSPRLVNRYLELKRRNRI